MNDLPDATALAETSETATAVSSTWRAFFWVATICSLIVGLAGMLSPEATIDARIIGLLIFGFGIVYFHVAREPLRYGPVLWAGILTKVGVIALLAPQVFGPSINPLFAGVLIAFGVFAFGFLIFLLTKIEGSAGSENE
ncbi:MAG: hypothetical protein ABJP48_13555 [Erythrobacter sp.]